MKQYKNSIVRKFIVYIFLISLTVTFIISSAILFQNYQSFEEDVKKQLGEIEKSVASSLSRALWDLDDDQINNLLDGIKRLPDIAYVAITLPDEEEPTYVYGEPIEKNLMERTVNLEYLSKEDELQTVGSLKIVASLEGPRKRIERQVLALIGIEFLQTIIGAILIFLMFRNLISRHLFQMALMAESLNLDKLDEKKLVLDRKETNDELERVVSAFNQMKLNLRASHEKLQDYASNLEAKVAKRTHELEEIQKIALENAHQAGKAEIVTGILHNIGNVVNSLSISISQLKNLVKKSSFELSLSILKLIQSHKDNLDHFFSETEKGKGVVDNIDDFVTYSNEQNQLIESEMERLQQLSELIKGAIKSQQGFAKNIRLKERLDIKLMVQEVVSIASNSSFTEGVKIEIDGPKEVFVNVEKSRFLHIVLNLIKNAAEAMSAIDPHKRKIDIKISQEKDVVSLSVKDYGIGIEPELLNKIFSHGFTTKEKGHGFGLHHSIIAINEMGGNIKVKSNGHGQGAIFTITLDAASPKNAEKP